ncbi:hypothetical protein BH24BAC1_BH24BAC1_06790 [soil metagenome]
MLFKITFFLPKTYFIKIILSEAWLFGSRAIIFRSYTSFLLYSNRNGSKTK